MTPPAHMTCTSRELQGSAALTFKVIAPTFRPQSSPSGAVSHILAKEGALFLEFAPLLQASHRGAWARDGQGRSMRPQVPSWAAPPRSSPQPVESFSPSSGHSHKWDHKLTLGPSRTAPAATQKPAGPTAAAAGARSYDWPNKLTFALAVRPHQCWPAL